MISQIRDQIIDIVKHFAVRLLDICVMLNDSPPEFYQ